MVLIEVGQHIVDYVSQRVCGGINIGEAVGIGVSRDEVILGGVAFYNWNYKNIFMHAASDSRRWLNKTYLKYMFSYAFDTCEAARITGLVDENNYHARQFNERIGFTEEARMKNACLGGDILIYAMHRDQCRWIR
jgi:RimJ/RimL family protein N-acetyltransferase